MVIDIWSLVFSLFITFLGNSGGIRFFDSSNGAAYWAMNINRVFIEQHNYRYKYNVDKFSFDRFKALLISLYSTSKK